MKGERVPCEQETRNCLAVMDHVAVYLRQCLDAPLTDPLILRFPQTVTAGIVYPNNELGHYRNRHEYVR